MHDEKGKNEQVINELQHRLTVLEAERQQAQHEALEIKRYLAQVVDSSTDAIIATDKEDNVVLFNEGAQTLLGYPAEELVGRRVSRHTSESAANDVTREILSGHGTQLRQLPTLSVPDTMDENKVTAHFENGILRVTLPNRPELVGSPRKIEIKKT